MHTVLNTPIYTFINQIMIHVFIQRNKVLKMHCVKNASQAHSNLKYWHKNPNN